MSEASERRHGLEALLASAVPAPRARIDIAVLSGRGFLDLRLDPRDELAARAAERALGQPVPLAANTFSDGEHRVYWLGPDEWLIETGAERAPALGRELAEATAGGRASVNDVSGGHVALHVGGADWRMLLAKGCTLDLHPRAFGPGQCARAGLAKASALLAAAGGAPGCTLIVARSFADYLVRWLAHAAHPHGARFSARQPDGEA